VKGPFLVGVDIGVSEAKTAPATVKECVNTSGVKGADVAAGLNGTYGRVAGGGGGLTAPSYPISHWAFRICDPQPIDTTLSPVPGYHLLIPFQV
jgi:hypothetical protein